MLELGFCLFLSLPLGSQGALGTRISQRCHNLTGLGRVDGRWRNARNCSHRKQKAAGLQCHPLICFPTRATLPGTELGEALVAGGEETQASFRLSLTLSFPLLSAPLLHLLGRCMPTRGLELQASFILS